MDGCDQRIMEEMLLFIMDIEGWEYCDFSLAFSLLLYQAHFCLLYLGPVPSPGYTSTKF